MSAMRLFFIIYGGMLIMSIGFFIWRRSLSTDGWWSLYQRRMRRFGKHIERTPEWEARAKHSRSMGNTVVMFYLVTSVTMWFVLWFIYW